MQVVIRLEEKVAEVHIVPTTPLNKAQLALVRNYGDKSIRLKHGDGDELVLVIEDMTGSERNAAIEEEPEQIKMPQRAQSEWPKPRP